MLEGRGDALPVSALPCRRHLARRHGPLGEAQHLRHGAGVGSELCIQCGNCAFVCPHAVIRAKGLSEPASSPPPRRTASASAPLATKGFPDSRYTLQVYVEDCTGCGLCVEACPARPHRARSAQGDQHGAAAADLLERERGTVDFFETLPGTTARGRLRHRRGSSSSSSRCSSSPAPAPAAARRPT
jgi:pyruvate-ferredoxin/flavodoxin oxidoreductase